MYIEACFRFENVKAVSLKNLFQACVGVCSRSNPHRDSSTLQDAINYLVALCLIGWASNLSWMIQDVVAKATEGNLPAQPYFHCVALPSQHLIQEVILWFQCKHFVKANIHLWAWCSCCSKRCITLLNIHLLAEQSWKGMFCFPS